uniref:Major facilitator superfamily (MFS) profile domain-containing protein n=1 Tax=Lotharella globosa TaxID=91324 RepID=A0A7S4E030_9EUKA|mmetsp:Transcript_15896/g.32302  ORF Transcript_15896/g.32302 Transcript_15896/m.32302 type:complete len:531 (+) Transcript_15896:31-1623(+)
MAVEATAPPVCRPGHADAGFDITWRRTVLAIVSNWICLIVGGGSLFGYNALRPVLIADGAYEELCEPGNSGCPEQRLALNLCEVASFVCVNVTILPLGMLMDRLGPRLACFFNTLLYAVGFSLLILATRLKASSFYMWGLVVVACSANFSFLTAVATAKMFRDESKTYFISAGTALAYEVAPIMMYILQVVVPSYMTLETGFIIIATLTCLCAATVGLFHLSHEEACRVDAYHERKRLAASPNDRWIEKRALSGENPDRAWAHMTHPRYVLMVLFMCIVNSKNQFYVATFADQIDYAAAGHVPSSSPGIVAEGWDARVSVNRWFDIGTFVAPVVTLPFIISFLGYHSDRFDLVFGYLWGMTITHAVLNTFGKRSLEAQFVAMVIFFALRPLKWSACCDYLHHQPYRLGEYGRLYGVLSLVCAAGAMCLYPLSWMAYNWFDGSFYTPNLILTALEVIVVGFPVYLHATEHSSISSLSSTWSSMTSFWSSSLSPWGKKSRHCAVKSLFDKEVKVPLLGFRNETKELKRVVAA